MSRNDATVFESFVLLVHFYLKVLREAACNQVSSYLRRGLPEGCSHFNSCFFFAVNIDDEADSVFLYETFDALPEIGLEGLSPVQVNFCPAGVSHKRMAVCL